MNLKNLLSDLRVVHSRQKIEDKLMFWRCLAIGMVIIYIVTILLMP